MPGLPAQLVQELNVGTVQLRHQISAVYVPANRAYYTNSGTNLKSFQLQS